MPSIDNNAWLAILVKKAPGAKLHLCVDNRKAGTVFFACEQAPLMTFQSFGPPQRCPICREENPICGTQEEK